jgi:hypothetical protein
MPPVPPAASPILATSPSRTGRAGWALLAWLVGIPLPIVLIILLMGSCT